jgi:nucleotide-binding universal stress UspA family protein
MASHTQVELTNAFNISENLRFSLYPKSIIKKQLAKLNLKKINIKIIESKTISLTKMVTEFVKYSELQKVDLILLASNSKKKFPNFIFGSFAETVMHLSNLDLLIYSQNLKDKNQMPKRVLYANDFSLKGRKGILKAAIYAHKWKAKLYVIHVPRPEPELDLTDEEFEFSIDQNFKKCEQLLQKLKMTFELVNVLPDISIDELSIDEIIIRFANKNKIDLIAMTTQAKNLKVLLGGSITRKVLRRSKYPVLILKT